VRNFREVTNQFPEVESKVLMLGLFRSNPELEIADPLHMGEDAARDCVREIGEAVDGLARWIGLDSVAGQRA
jgi:hypothetical protein